MHHPLHQGAHYFLRGLWMLRRPEVRPFVLVPLLINALLFAALLVTLYLRFDSWITWWFGWLPGWIYDWLKWSLLPLFFLSLQGILIFFLAFMANLLSGSFNSLLSEGVEQVATGNPLPSPAQSLQQAARNFFPSLLEEAGKITYFLAWSAPFTLLLFIPIIKVFILPLWILSASWLLTLQYMDYPTTNHNISAPHTRRLLRKHPMLTLGFGLTTLLFSSLPLLNFITIPAAVAGATLLWVEKFDQI